MDTNLLLPAMKEHQVQFQSLKVLSNPTTQGAQTFLVHPSWNPIQVHQALCTMKDTVSMDDEACALVDQEYV